MFHISDKDPAVIKQENKKNLAEIFGIYEEVLDLLLQYQSIRAVIIDELISPKFPIKTYASGFLYRWHSSQKVQKNEIQERMCKIVDEPSSTQIRTIQKYQLRSRTIDNAIEALKTDTKIPEEVKQRVTNKTAERRRLINKIVTNNLRTIIRPAFKNARNEEDREDLFQELTFALIQAAEQFNPYLKHAFSTYVFSKIRPIIGKHKSNVFTLKIGKSGLPEGGGFEHYQAKEEEILRWLQEEMEQGGSPDPLECLIQDERQEVYKSLINSIKDERVREAYLLMLKIMKTEGSCTYQRLAEELTDDENNPISRAKAQHHIEKAIETLKRKTHD